MPLLMAFHSTVCQTAIVYFLSPPIRLTRPKPRGRQLRPAAGRSAALPAPPAALRRCLPPRRAPRRPTRCRPRQTMRWRRRRWRPWMWRPRWLMASRAAAAVWRVPEDARGFVKFVEQMCRQSLPLFHMQCVFSSGVSLLHVQTDPQRVAAGGRQVCWICRTGLGLPLRTAAVLHHCLHHLPFAGNVS